MRIIDMEQFKKKREAAPDNIVIDELRAGLKDYQKVTDFKPGDIVRVKMGCGALMRIPKPGRPAIVVETDVKFSPEDVVPMEPGTSEFATKRNLRIGLIEDNVFVTFVVDPQRFELYQ